MVGRTVAVAVVAAGALFLTACQPTVDVSRAGVDVARELPPAPPDRPLLPADPRGQPIRPSADVGAEVFRRARCDVCHGPQGRGDGPAAAGLTAEQKTLLHDLARLVGIRLRAERLPSRPANFHNAVAMRLNSPFSMYETVTRGRPHTAMPAFGPRPSYGATSFGVRLTDEERWHVIFFEWAFATTPEEVARGRALYETRAIEVDGRRLTCASCHGLRGDGRGPEGVRLSQRLWTWARGQGPGIFTDVNLMAQRKPSELFQVIVDGRGEMPAYQGRLTDDEIWAVVNYIYTFVYDYPGMRR